MICDAARPSEVRSPGRFRRTALTACVLTAALLAPIPLASSAVGAPTPVTCGSTLTVDTTLTKNLTCPSGDGLILAEGVRLDLGGHKLSGSGGSSVGVTLDPLGRNDVRNGIISNWGYGISQEGDNSTDPATTVTGITRVALNRAGIFTYFGGLRIDKVVALDSPIVSEINSKYEIINSVLTRSSIVGFYYGVITIDRSVLVASTVTFSANMMGSIKRSTLDGLGTSSLGSCSSSLLDITQNTIRNYQQPITGDECQLTLADNRISGMQKGAVTLSSFLVPGPGPIVVRGNTFTKNKVGLKVARDGMSIENNTFQQNVDGIVLEPPDDIGVTGSTITGNIFKNNTGSGIRSLPGLAAIGNNTATNNGGYGIYAPGATDLGGNVAYRNKLGQCVGVTCTGK